MMSTIVVLISHEHNLAVTQLCAFISSLVLLSRCEPEDHSQVLELFVLHHSLGTLVAHIQQLSAQWENAVLVAAHHR